jgi:hypothetical protein
MGRPAETKLIVQVPAALPDAHVPANAVPPFISEALSERGPAVVDMSTLNPAQDAVTGPVVPGST